MSLHVGLWLQRQARPPRPLRMALAHYLSSDELLRAIGNMEGRDEYFWLYRESWALAQAVLGIDPAVDRFSSTDWRLALEPGLGALAHRSLLLATCRSNPGSPMLRRLDEFVDAHWVECTMNTIWYGLARQRLRRLKWREAVTVLTRRERADGSDGVLDSLASALSDLDPAERVVVTAPTDAPQLAHYERVCTLVHAAGMPVLWVGYSRTLAVPPSALTVSERPWGHVVRAPMPTLGEVMKREPAVAAKHRAALQEMRRACRALPKRWREAARAVEPALSSLLAEWVSSRAMAETVLDRVRASTVYVLADKHIQARAFVLGARRRGVRAIYGALSLGVTTPAFWPITGRVLVANGARVERMVEGLRMPHERIEPVGSLEVDELLEALGGVPAPPSGGELRFALLLKWPAHVAFGPPADVRDLLAALDPDSGAWSCVVRPHPKDFHDYGWLGRALPGRVRVSRPGYWDTAGLVETFAGTDLVVAAMGNAVLISIAAGKPTVIYNPDPRINLGHDRLLARDDLPRHIRFVSHRDELLRLLRRVMDGQEPELMKPEPLAPSFERYLFHALDGCTAARIAKAVLEGARSGVKL